VLKQDGDGLRDKLSDDVAGGTLENGTCALELAADERLGAVRVYEPKARTAASRKCQLVLLMLSRTNGITWGTTSSSTVEAIKARQVPAAVATFHASSSCSSLSYRETPVSGCPSLQSPLGSTPTCFVRHSMRTGMRNFMAPLM
jgi:hypothetical protein